MSDVAHIVPPGAAVIERETSVVVVGPSGMTVVAQQPAQPTVVVTRGIPGRSGDAAGGALLAVNRLSEFDTEQKKADARANIGLAVIDGGTFF